MPSPSTAHPPFADAARRVLDGVATLRPREAVREIADGFREHNLLVEASGIAFRISLALIPCALFVLGLIGFLQLDGVWRQDVAPDLRSNVSTAAFKLIDDTVMQVLEQKQLFWVTLGAGIAVWELSGIVRTITKILNRIYRVGEERSTRQIFLSSFAVGAAVGALILAALAVVRLGPLVIDALLGSGILSDIVSVALRWTLAIGMLLLAVGLMVRAGPDLDRPLRWVSFGAVVVVGSWALMTLLFGLYLAEIADYGSVFGSLATVFILLEYLFGASVVFIGGLLLDWRVQKSAGG